MVECLRDPSAKACGGIIVNLSGVVIRGLVAMRRAAGFR